MCGLAGFFGVQSPNLDVTLVAMGEAIRDRGPDDCGSFRSDLDNVGLVHRRLSILDVSNAGAQPMLSSCKRFCLVFNGEIYNHVALRERLERDGTAPTWRGRSDTETLLAAIAAWGLQRTLEASVGMFALALWDGLTKEISLARDRLGEKPLYYGWFNGGLIFASELKALEVIPGFQGEIDRSALALFMRHNYVPAPFSIYSGISKLTPGTKRTFSIKNLHSKLPPPEDIFWSATHVAKIGMCEERSFASDEDAINEFEICLRRSIRGQMVADVPLGAFLSGGIDSSLITALMQAESIATGAPPVKTFTIGFKESTFNEAGFAKKVAQHLKCDHTERYLSTRDAIDIVPKLASIYDEPFADSSQLPTYLLSRVAREQVKVALTGDGGDELFGGYARYAMTENLWCKLSKIPHPLRNSVAMLIERLPVRSLNGIGKLIRPVLHESLGSLASGDKIKKGAAVLASAGVGDLYHALTTHWDPSDVVLGFENTVPREGPQLPELPRLAEQLMLTDTLKYLPDDILVKVDRAAMSVGLETRVPLLDHRLVEFAWRLPVNLKRRDGREKWLLRQVLYRHLPPALVDRPKMGFAVPIGEWLRGPLRDWAESLLHPLRLRQDGYFDPLPIRQKWSEHLSGHRNWHYQLWNVLMFNAWLDSR